MRRPERVPPACMLVRPAKTIMTSLPKVSWFFWSPAPRPSPAPTITVLEMMPQAMPNIVSNVRRLCAHSVASVSTTRSRKDMASRPQNPLLKNHFLFFVQALQDFRLHTVGDPQLHVDFLLAVFRLEVGCLDGSVAILVVNQGGFRNHQNVFLFFQQDFRVGAHVSLQLERGVGDRHAH